MPRKAAPGILPPCLDRALFFGAGVLSPSPPFPGPLTAAGVGQALGKCSLDGLPSPILYVMR